MSGWRDISELTDADGYVLGVKDHAVTSPEQVYFIGRRYDLRENALLNEWSGRWSVCRLWQPLPAVEGLLA